MNNVNRNQLELIFGLIEKVFGINPNIFFIERVWLISKLINPPVISKNKYGMINDLNLEAMNVNGDLLNHFFGSKKIPEKIKNDGIWNV